MKIRIAGTTPESIVDGKGMRFTVFTQGCPHACKGCHNPQSWSNDGGKIVDTDELFNDFAENPILSGMTFSGGEPFLQPVPLIELAKKVKAIGKDITIYTGYTFEQLESSNNTEIKELLSYADILIDGKFEEDKKDLELLFRGSSNQRVIDINETRKEGKLVLAY